MARMNIYLPDDLAAKARAAGLNISALARAAVEAELARSLTDGWLERVLAWVAAQGVKIITDELELEDVTLSGPSEVQHL